MSRRKPKTKEKSLPPMMGKGKKPLPAIGLKPGSPKKESAKSSDKTPTPKKSGGKRKKLDSVTF